jgi:hypothetical protein
MSQTALQWLRAGAKTYGAQPKGAPLATTPQTCAKSPCCKLPLVKLPRGLNEIDHYRCAECSLLYVWDGKAWIVCELQDKHRAQSRERSHDDHA